MRCKSVCVKGVLCFLFVNCLDNVPVCDYFNYFFIERHSKRQVYWSNGVCYVRCAVHVCRMEIMLQHFAPNHHHHVRLSHFSEAGWPVAAANYALK